MSKTAMLWLSVAALCGAVFVAFLPLETVAQQSGATPKVVSPGVKSIGSSKQTPAAGAAGGAPIGSGKTSVESVPVIPREKTITKQLTLLQKLRDCFTRCHAVICGCSAIDLCGPQIEDPCARAAVCERGVRCYNACRAAYHRAGGT